MEGPPTDQPTKNRSITRRIERRTYTAISSLTKKLHGNIHASDFTNAVKAGIDLHTSLFFAWRTFHNFTLIATRPESSKSKVINMI